MAALFTEFKQRSIHFSNRIGVSPMCQYSAIDGLANDWHLVHLGSRAVSGAAVVIVEATAVCPEGRITHGCLGLWKKEQIVQLKQIADFITQQGSVPAIQLAHAGRKASTHKPWEGGKPLTLKEGAWHTYAPSALGYRDTDPVTMEISGDQIEILISQFMHAAGRALEAGFKMIELHAAHGYLLHQFLSPLSNKRSDAYGGSFENRIRLLCQIVQAVRTVWPKHLPLWVRLSCSDWVADGWNIEDSVALSLRLKTLGVDLIDCSSGGNSPLQSIPVGPGYLVHFARQIRQEAAIATAAVGLLTTPQQCEEIIKNGDADMVLLAREFLRNPTFPQEAAKDLGADMAWPIQYVRSK